MATLLFFLSTVLIIHRVTTQMNSTSVNNSTAHVDIRAKDLPIPMNNNQYGAKTFLKNKLLDNLNNFFGTKKESLEMLDSEPSEMPNDDNVQMQAKPTDIPNMKLGGLGARGRISDRFHRDDTFSRFPTLIPTVTTTVPPMEIEKKRSEGRMVSEKTADTIRKWRKRLYKAFKGRSSQSKPEAVVRITDQTKTTPESSEILQFNDETPLVIDKNRQLLLSRKQTPWNLQGTKQIQTFGKDPQGKIVPLFGMEKASFRFDRMAGAPAQLPQTYGLNPQRDAYKTANHQAVAYLPSSGMQFTPEPATATASPYISSGIQNGPAPQSMTFHSYGTAGSAMNGASSTDYNAPTSYSGSLPGYGIPAPAPLGQYNSIQSPMPSMNTPGSYNPIPAFGPQSMPNGYSAYNAVQPALPAPPQFPAMPSYNPAPAPLAPDMNFMTTMMTSMYTTMAPTSYTTQSILEDGDLQDEDDDDEMFGPPLGMNKDCAECSHDGQIISEEKCNSMRLRTLIQNNIVPNDADASKRAVQQAAETETGIYFDAICGTGFFSYIAHTDEFCLASSMGVNCYVFSPVCSGSSSISSFSKTRKTYMKHARRKTFLNKN